MFLAAQANSNQNALWIGMFYLAGIVLLVGLGILVVVAVRKWSRTGEFDGVGEGLTLGQARQMKAAGLITQQEFDEVRRVILGANPPPTSSGNTESAV